MTIISLSSHTPSTPETRPAVIAKKWRSVGLSIRGKVAHLVAESHGKRHLREGTKERLAREIYNHVAFLAKARDEHGTIIDEILK
jgi:hypothetical protein